MLKIRCTLPWTEFFTKFEVALLVVRGWLSWFGESLVEMWRARLAEGLKVDKRV